MVLIEVGSVVVLTTSETTTSRMLAVLAYTSMTGRDVSTVLASLGVPRRHFLEEALSGDTHTGCCTWQDRIWRWLVYLDLFVNVAELISVFWRLFRSAV